MILGSREDDDGRAGCQVGPLFGESPGHELISVVVEWWGCCYREGMQEAQDLGIWKKFPVLWSQVRTEEHDFPIGLPFD